MLGSVERAECRMDRPGNGGGYFRRDIKTRLVEVAAGFEILSVVKPACRETCGDIAFEALGIGDVGCKNPAPGGRAIVLTGVGGDHKGVLAGCEQVTHRIAMRAIEDRAGNVEAVLDQRKAGKAMRILREVDDAGFGHGGRRGRGDGFIGP